MEVIWTLVGGLSVHTRASGIAHPKDVPGGTGARAGRLQALHGPRPQEPGCLPSGLCTRAARLRREREACRVLNVTGLSDSLAAWMREIGLERAALIGNSFGYQIIADLAVRHPERFERTVLQGPAMDPGREPFWDRYGDSCSPCPTNPSPPFRSNSSTTSRQRCSVGYLRFPHCWVSKARTGTEACRPFADPSLPPGGSDPG